MTSETPSKKKITDFGDSMLALRFQMYWQNTKHKRDPTQIDQ